MKFTGKIIVSILILAAGAAATTWLYANKPETKKSIPTKPIPMVSVMEITPSDEPIFVEAYGTVVPARKITLLSEVEGRLLSISQDLVPGGIVKRGQFLAQIDPEDYELQIKERQADVIDAQYQLEIEQGKQVIAKREWTLFEKNKDDIEASKALALREPHLKNAKAKIDAAKSRLAAAELARKRTTVDSPFNAMVLEEFAEKGQWIGRQTPIATLVDTDRFWVQVSVPPGDLSRLKFANGSNKSGSRVTIVVADDSETPVTRQGHLFKLLGDLDPKGRMARVLVTIDNPLNLHSTGGNAAHAHRDRILLGSYVRVMIEGGVLENVYSVPREAIRGNDQVWIYADDKLDIRQAKIRWRRKDELLVSLDLQPGERIITSRIQSPLPGMSLRTRKE